MQFILLPFHLQIQLIDQNPEITSAVLLYDYGDFLRAQQLTDVATTVHTDEAMTERHNLERVQARTATSGQINSDKHKSFTISLHKFPIRNSALKAKALTRFCGPQVRTINIDVDCLWASVRNACTTVTPLNMTMSKLSDTRFVFITVVEVQEFFRDPVMGRWSTTKLHAAAAKHRDVLTLELKGYKAIAVYQHRACIFKSTVFNIRHVMSRISGASRPRHVTQPRRSKFKHTVGRRNSNSIRNMNVRKAQTYTKPANVGRSMRGPVPRDNEQAASPLQRAGLNGSFNDCTINLSF